MKNGLEKTRSCEGGTQFGNSYLKETIGSMFLRSFSRLLSAKDWCDDLIAPSRSNIDPLSLTEQTQHIIAYSLSDLLFLKRRRSLEFFPQRVVFSRSNRQQALTWWFSDKLLCCSTYKSLDSLQISKLWKRDQGRNQQNTDVICIW